MHTIIHFGRLDYLIVAIYFVFVLGIGWMLRRTMKGSGDFLTSGTASPAGWRASRSSRPTWGRRRSWGWGPQGAKYGIMTSHFYWIGAIPAMVFLGVFMMPFYYGSKARSVPEYLKLRFDEKTRGFNAFSFAVMTIFSSGISMYAMAKLMGLLLGWSFEGSIAISAVIVLVYIFLGGLTSAIYNEVLQFFMIVFGFAPLVFLGLKDVGGWSGLKAKLADVATSQALRAGGLERGLEPHRLAVPEPDGRRVVRPGDGPRVRPLLRLLVHGLPRGPEGARGRLDDGRTAHAADRGDPEDALSLPRHPARDDRDRPHLPGLKGRDRRVRAPGEERLLRLRPGGPLHARPLLPDRDAGPRDDGPHGVLHVGDGRAT
jgi:hypothetical protein